MSRLHLLSSLLRDLEMDIGTNEMALLVLETLARSVRALKIKNVERFREEFFELANMFSNTEPKFGVMRHHFDVLTCHVKNLENVSDWKKTLIKDIKMLLKQSNSQKLALVEYAEKIKINHKTVLIHDHSRTVHSVMAHLKSIGHNFRVVVAEQDFDKTHQNIERLHNMRVPFQVVPAYMLSHVHNSVDMVFFGAVTLKDTMDFVMAPGAHGIISEFHTVKVPIYMFINTLKFSLWKSKSRGEIFIHQHKRMHVSQPIEYDRIKYSHDRVPADMFHRIVTDEGVFTPKQLQKVFQQKFNAEKCLR